MPYDVVLSVYDLYRENWRFRDWVSRSRHIHCNLHVNSRPYTSRCNVSPGSQLLAKFGDISWSPFHKQFHHFFPISGVLTTHGMHSCRASNSPALRGSLPPGHYFSRSPGKHVESPTSMKKIPPSMQNLPHQWGKTFGNNCLTNFQCNHKNHIYLSI